MTRPQITRRLFLATAAGGALILAAGCVPDMPVMRAPGGAANLGFGLWAGVPGARFGDRVDRAVGPRRIRGPRRWTHPITRQNMTIYVRTKRDSSGTKTAYYTMRPDGTALARVFDSRPGRPDRYFTGDAFVPMGPWRSGMVKRYDMSEYAKGRPTRYTVSIRVTRAAFTHKGVAGSMEYVWTQKTPSGRKTAELRYIHSPGIGFVDIDNLMK